MSASYRANSLNEAQPSQAKKGRPTKPVIDCTDYDFTEEDLLAGLHDPMWRMNNLYRVVNEQKEVVTFKLRPAQKHLLNGLHTRNLILKARKEGISTTVQLFMLDTAIFSPNVRGVVIAQDRETAESIFKDVIKFAYDNLPEPLRNAAVLETTPTKSSIEFSNPLGNSRVEVRTTARGTTPTILHVSELGQISVDDPGKADEILTGAITAVAEDGLVFVESTARGKEGTYFDLVQTARKTQDSGQPLWKLDFKFFFFGWWEDPKYTMPHAMVVIPKEDVEYFEELEREIGRKLTPGQKAWYVKYRDSVYAGDEEKMWREMPSTPDEAFKISLEGAYFREQFRRVRKEGRITLCPYDEFLPVSVFFDIGQTDETAVWAVQKKRGHYAVINFTEDSGETFKHFVDVINSWGYTIDQCFLPHDANHTSQGVEKNQTPADMMRELVPHWQIWVLSRTPDKQISIQQARNVLHLCVFDEVNCAKGIKHLEAYRKKKDKRTQTWSKIPRHGPESNAADAFQQFAQAVAQGLFTGGRAIGSDFNNIEEPELGF